MHQKAISLACLIFISFIQLGLSQSSPLSDGTIYKIEIKESGIYKLDLNYFKSLEGMNISTVNPNHIAIYGNGGKMLPEMNNEDRIEGLEENAIFVKGATDNKFDDGDFVLFYAEGPNTIDYNETTEKYEFADNYYATSSYYYLKILKNNTTGKRINAVENLNTAEFTFSKTEKFQYHNLDKRNLLGGYFSTHGSGKTWYGEAFFSNNRIQTFDQYFDFTDMILDDPVLFKTALAVRSEGSSLLKLDIGGNKYSKTGATISKSSAYNIYAKSLVIEKSIPLNSLNPKVEIEFPSNGYENQAWLDYIQFTSLHKIKYNNKPLLIRNQSSKNHASAAFHIENYSNKLHLWNISNVLNPIIQKVSDGDVKYTTHSINNTFLLFDENIVKTPVSTQIVENQNIRNLESIDMLIIYHKDFMEEANRLADHRRTYNNYSVLSIDIEKIYNEFSSGRCDPSAIRDFARYIKKKYPNFNYMLLFGDGSYDYRGIVEGLANQNFIPVFETNNSLDPIKAFPSDDYFALLDDTEGGNLVGALDIAVGRIPVRTISEATAVVDKILSYETSPNALGSWRLNMTFCADDEDSSSHLVQTESIANSAASKQPDFNQSKVYFDAYQQVSTPGGHRYPSVTKIINNKIYQGQLLINYLGHGGPTGWAQERVLQIEDINNWQNKDKLTVMITATCSFAGYDDAAITTAGEAVLLNPHGGAVALLTTTRAVYSSSNKRLAQEVYNHIFMRNEGVLLGIGEVLNMAKNTNKADTSEINARKFTLLGDPAMRLAIPKYQIRTTSINGHDVFEPDFKDTLSALEIVKIEGDIIDLDGHILSDFNGIIEPTIFDKPTSLKTLKNDPKSTIKTFKTQQNILFKGSASVVNGHFEYEFQMPKDIKFDYGYGKISHYASDGNNTDAKGSFNQITIGGTDDTNYSDDIGPHIELYMNDEDFGYNGYTNSSPILLVKLSDQSGINVTGTSIGHDITGLIDDDLNNRIVMNEYYKSTVNNSKSGQVEYPLSGLSLGHHSIKIKAWDIFNNLSEKILEFNVIDKADQSLYHVMNYPNPFVNNTNFRFEHGLPNTELEVICHIFTVSGKLIKTIETTRNSISQAVIDIPWDGTDDYHQKIGKGIYLYKIKVRSEELGISKESNFEKLVIL